MSPVSPPACPQHSPGRSPRPPQNSQPHPPAILLAGDVSDHCCSCLECQKSSPRGNNKAPLVPLPVIDVPFKRIAMDIVGPLPRSSSGNRFILVICDYASRYPEAIPLRRIDASHIANELVKLFARVGVPEEILTDQGTNFTSHLLQEIYKLLRIKPMRTTPYHPQTDGLVERSNQCYERPLPLKERTGMTSSHTSYSLTEKSHKRQPGSLPLNSSTEDRFAAHWIFSTIHGLQAPKRRKV